MELSYDGSQQKNMNLKYNILAIIPARMGSSRFPGKPMALIGGTPMIGHVYNNVKKNKLLREVIVATCDYDIFNYIESIGGRAIMTSNKHERASDRCAEALLKIENKDNITFDIIVMVQGDEPMVHSDMITQAVNPMLSNSKILITNLLGKIKNIKEFQDRNCIKVVCDKDGYALYFSRRSIPENGKIESASVGKQICIIPFQRDFLIKYNKLKETPLEIAESIDMPRVLEHGMKVLMIPTDYQTYAVDTEEDLKKVESLIRVN